MIQKLVVLSKKSNITVIIAIIIIILLMSGAFILIYFAYNEDEPEKTIPMIKMYVNAEDSETQENLQANFYLTFGNDTFLEEGILNKGAFRELLVPRDHIMHFHCWNDNYYLVKGHKQITQRELEYNSSVFTCSMYKIGNLEVKETLHNNKISLNVTSTGGWYYRMSLCLKWTAGILDVSMDQQTITCENDTWKNFTEYYAENNTYIYLPEGQYSCSGEIQNCDLVIGQRCKLSKMPTPERYQNKVDYCTYTGKTLSRDQSISMELNILPLQTINELDYVKIIFIDHDRRYNQQENRYTWFNDFNDDDIIEVVKYIKS